MPNPTLLRVVARSILAGEPVAEQIAARVEKTLGRRWRWLGPLSRSYVAAFAGRTRPRLRDVVRFLRAYPGFRKARVRQWVGEPAQMQPVPAAESWLIPAIESAGELAAWLGLDPDELAWFGDVKGLNRRAAAGPRLSHYHYRVLTKGSGGVRLIEAPKSRLKQLQRQILSQILDKIPPHPSVHGFVQGRSIQTFAAPHAGQPVVLRMDLRDFFPSFTSARIQSLFRTLGYPEPVADALAGICTNAAPRRVVSEPVYWQRHLPQGAPTSPALANICTYRADCRLTGLAAAAGVAYTRYADDLAFSGDREFSRFSVHVAAILGEEGFTVQHRKTRIMRQGVRQHLAGLAVNQKVNVIRADFDLLKAILTNCVRRGPEGQDRAHLEGRVAFMESINPGKAQRLRRVFEQIRWPHLQ